VAFFVSIVFLDIVQIVTAVMALDRVQLKHASCGSLRGGGYRMMIVRCILAETTTPERIRPRIEIWPVKGHFLS